VLREAQDLAARGYTDIQLLGQNVNSYRDPSPAGLDFAKLLRAVGSVPGIRRVRFTTSHPRDFVKDIIDAIDENPALCNHVHLPVQSGSSRILDRMNRLYTRDEYMRRIDWMKRAKRDIAISTDIIVGFPGETEEDFNATLDLLDQVEYDSIFAFKYSKRPNTSALQYEDHIPEEEKVRRLAIVQERQRAIQVRRNARYVGEVDEVMVEGFNKATGQWIGRTSQNKTLNFQHGVQTAGLLGSYLPVVVTRAGANSLVGESIPVQ
jgi:tRNA-2-methylthio-N6-dimethylallyladenosine synthase